VTDLTDQTFVLVHGAWHGGWCWRDVARALRLRGAEVFTPTLTGMGERQHLRAAYQGLSTFVDDVVAVITQEELTNVTLVGHSFGGMVITGVADRLQDRIKRLVYLDAAVPRDGQSMTTQSAHMAADKIAETVEQMRGMAMATPWLPPFPIDFIGLGDAPKDVQDRDVRGTTDHPVSSLIDPLHFVNGGPKAPCTFIVCDAPPMPNSSFVAHYENAAAGKYGDHWTTRRIATGHMCMFTALEETVALLAEAALAP
jgi:pimeloyl-ACP methyl ester carboxylesterase